MQTRFANRGQNRGEAGRWGKGTMTNYDRLKAQCEGRNINPETLLATDYLNHFNEVIMLLDMVPDMPDILEDCKEWQPKSYAEHFHDSSFSDKELAILAYHHAPARYRQPFDETIGRMNALALSSIAEAESALAEGRTEAVTDIVRTASRTLQKMMDVASAIIHGSQKTLLQAEIDTLINE